MLNDAASINLLDTTLAGAFVARCCAGYRIETAGGVFQVRDDDPAPRVGAGLDGHRDFFHRNPTLELGRRAAQRARSFMPLGY
jgi:hypothetical protein